MLYALWLTGSALRVEHCALGLVGNRSRWLRANRILPRFISGDRAVPSIHVALDAARNHIGRVHLAHDVGHRVRCDESFRAGGVTMWAASSTVRRELIAV